MIFTDDERDYLNSQWLGRLATRRSDGSLQNNPVGFSLDAATGSIDITGRALGRTRKFANVADNAQVALVVDDLVSRDPWTVRGVEIRGTGVALTGQETPSDYTSAEIIRITARRVISWGLTTPGMHGREVAAPAVASRLAR